MTNIKNKETFNVDGILMERDLVELLTEPILREEVQKEIDREIINEMKKQELLL